MWLFGDYPIISKWCGEMTSVKKLAVVGAGTSMDGRHDHDLWNGPRSNNLILGQMGTGIALVAAHVAKVRPNIFQNIQDVAPYGST